MQLGNSQKINGAQWADLAQTLAANKIGSAPIFELTATLAACQSPPPLDVKTANPLTTKPQFVAILEAISNPKVIEDPRAVLSLVAPRYAREMYQSKKSFETTELTH